MAQLKDIEILTHCDVTRLHRAYLMCRTMPEQLQLTLVIGYKDPKDKEYSLANKPANMEIYFEEYDPATTYPTNRFRNIAFAKSTRDFVFYLDVDFIFQKDFWENFEQKYMTLLGEDKVLCPVPLFDKEKPAYLSDYDGATLVKSETTETHEGILGDDFRRTATLFKFHDRWVKWPQKEELQNLTPVMRSIRNGTLPPEPWGILHRSRYLYADESFGQAKDKQQFVCRLLDSGLSFHSMRDCVIYHLWHPDSRLNVGREQQNCINTIIFNKRYLHKYQNFFFQLQHDALYEPLLALLGEFSNTPPIVEIDPGMLPEDVIPLLKKRTTLVSRAEFYPEYSVYGYKPVYVFDHNDLSSAYSRLSARQDVVSRSFNLGYFSLELDMRDGDNLSKRIQDLTGWPLEGTQPWVDRVSPWPESATSFSGQTKGPNLPEQKFSAERADDLKPSKGKKRWFGL